MQIDPRMVKWDEPEKGPRIDPKMVKWDAEPTLVDKAKQGAGNLLAGAVRGAGSIGATLTDIIRANADSVGAAVPVDLRPTASMNIAEAPRGDALRAAMDGGLQEMGANPDSLLYKGGKLGAEIAGTAGVGGALAKGVTALGATRFGAGIEPVIEGVARGLQTGGFRVAPLTGTGLGALTRVGTGAAVGGTAAGLINPDDAGIGAVIGGSLPGATQLAGKAGAALRGNAQPISPRLLDTARESMEAGYVIPPNMVRPSAKNQIIESFAGKQATQQLASTKNTEVTEGLVRQALGISEDVPLTQSTLENLRKTAGKAYADVSSLSDQAAADLEALKVARNEATGWFTAYNRSARPDDLAKAKAARELSNQLEAALEQHAKAAGKESLIPALRNARKEIAKTYTVGRALNDAAGTVDARVLGRMYEKGAPLSDELKAAGKFASAFPTIAKSPQQVGSPAAHNLRSMASMLMGGGGLATMGPAGLAAAALPFATGPAARSLMFSPAAQRGLLAGPVAPRESLGLLGQGTYRVLPLLPGE